MTSGAALSAAVAGGSLQIAGSSVMGLITAHTRGVPFQIVAPGTVYVSDKTAELLLVRKDAPIHTGADMNGKTIASPALGDLLSTAILSWIDQNGGDVKTVRQIELPSAATQAALESGRIDAAGFVEPRLSEALRGGNVRVLAKPLDAIGKRFMISAEFATADFINANRDVIARFAKAQCEANAFANAHPDQTAPWLADFAKIDVDAILHGRREIFDETMIVDNLQRVIDAAARYKVIAQSFDARDMISPVVLNAR